MALTVRGRVWRTSFFWSDSEQSREESGVPIVDDRRLTGNAGAAQVACLLAAECLVRPVAADTDIGVDLYCETQESGTPFLHFWIQVKSGPQRIYVPQDRTWASCSFDADHLRYWGRQPVPVFGALVPVPGAGCENADVYFCDISMDIIERGVPREGSRSIRSFLRLLPGDDDGLRALLDHQVVTASARWQCHMHGVVEPLPAVRPEYFRHYPPMPIVRYQRVISEQIRTTAAFTIIQAYSQGRIGVLDVRLRQILGQISAMQDVNHWENPMAAGLSLHQDGEFASARRYYEAARDCILRDPNVTDGPFRRENVALIERLMECAEEKEGLEVSLQ